MTGREKNVTQRAELATFLLDCWPLAAPSPPHAYNVSQELLQPHAGTTAPTELEGSLDDPGPLFFECLAPVLISHSKEQISFTIQEVKANLVLTTKLK